MTKLGYRIALAQPHHRRSRALSRQVFRLPPIIAQPTMAKRGAAATFPDLTRLAASPEVIPAWAMGPGFAPMARLPSPAAPPSIIPAWLALFLTLAPRKQRFRGPTMTGS